MVVGNQLDSSSHVGQQLLELISAIGLASPNHSGTSLVPSPTPSYLCIGSLPFLSGLCRQVDLVLLLLHLVGELVGAVDDGHGLCGGLVKFRG